MSRRHKLRPVTKPRGRPSQYTQDKASDICDMIAAGSSLRKICARDDMPDQTTVFRWLANNENFRLQYARAREAQADTYADEIPDIADDEADPQRARVRIDARKWAAGKLRPKKYGERVSAELSGPDGGPIETKDATPMETARRIAFLLASGAAQKDQP